MSSGCSLKGGCVKRFMLTIAIAVLPASVFAQVDALAHVCTWLSTGNDTWKQVSTIPWRSEGLGIGYDANSRAIIAQQAAEMRQNGIKPLLSWWGTDAPLGGDGYLDVWRTVATYLPAAILYEGTGLLRQERDGRWYIDAPDNAQKLRDDLTHLYTKYWSAAPERWYQRHGKFVIYLWPAHGMRGDLKSVLDALPFREKLYVVGTEFDALKLPSDVRMPILAGLDAVTGYGFYGTKLMPEYDGKLTDELIARYRFAALSWQEYLAAKLPGTELILPLQLAFDDRNVPGRDNPVYEATPEQAAKLFGEMRQMIGHFKVHCGNVPPVITVASYSEHFEGTALEPNNKFGSLWLEMLAKHMTQVKLPSSQCVR